MIITYDTDAGTVTIPGVEPVQVADVGQAVQVIEAAASEMAAGTGEGPAAVETTPPPEVTEEAMEEEAMMAAAQGKEPVPGPNKNPGGKNSTGYMGGY